MSNRARRQCFTSALLSLPLVIAALPSLSAPCDKPLFTAPVGWHPITEQDLAAALKEAGADEETTKATMEHKKLMFYDGLLYKEPSPKLNTRLIFVAELTYDENLFSLTFQRLSIFKSMPSKREGKPAGEAEFTTVANMTGSHFAYDYELTVSGLSGTIRNEIWLVPYCGCAYMVEAQYPLAEKADRQQIFQDFVNSIEFEQCLRVD